MKRSLAAFVLAALTAISAPAQKLYVADSEGPVTLVRTNGNTVGTMRTRNALKLWTAVAYGDVIATGTGGRVTLSLPGILSVSIPENSVFGYFCAGPGTDPQPFISLVAGNADINAASGVMRTLPVHDDRPERAADVSGSTDSATVLTSTSGASGPLAQLERCAAKLESVYAEMETLEADCESATAKLEAVTDEYRTLLAAASGTDADDGTGSAEVYRERELQVFRETQLYPTEDARSSIIREIQYRTILARTIRNHILSPLYMTEKTANIEIESRDARTAAFFERYAAVIGRYDDVLFK
jgi:hypothetical protein